MHALPVSRCCMCCMIDVYVRAVTNFLSKYLYNISLTLLDTSGLVRLQTKLTNCDQIYFDYDSFFIHRKLGYRSHVWSEKEYVDQAAYEFSEVCNCCLINRDFCICNLCGGNAEWVPLFTLPLLN